MGVVVARVCDGVKRISPRAVCGGDGFANRGDACGCRGQYRSSNSRRVNLVDFDGSRRLISAHARCVASLHSLLDVVARCGRPLHGKQGGGVGGGMYSNQYRVSPSSAHT